MINESKQTLIHMAMSDLVPLDTRYQVARELRYRQISEDDQADIIRMAAKGMCFKTIADELGISNKEVKRTLRGFHRRHKSDDNWKIGYKHTLKCMGRM